MIINDLAVKFLVTLGRLYKLTVSPYIPPACRFMPTCSEYAVQAIKKHGAIKGLYLSVFRLCRCHPFCKGGYDPVP